MTTKTQKTTAASTPATNVDEALTSLLTTSSKIRYLDSIGWTRGQIAKKLDKRYQHVRNVLITPLKKGE